MYAKSKAGSVPSDSQAREKLAMYVYEYLMHVGANSAAQVFLKEIGWEKTISLGDSPGFLHGWWCVFWDLYCASPEKRDTCEHSPEAKAFHDYSAATAPSPMNPVPSEGMCQGVPPGFYQPFIGPRYPHGGPRPGMQGHGPQPMLPGMDPSRQSHMMRMIQNRGMHGGSSWNGGPDQYQQPYGGIHRLPAAGSMHPHGNMSMSMHPRSQWPGGGPPSGGPAGPQAGAGPPGTPIMRSPPGTRPPSLMHPPPPIHRPSRFNEHESRKTPSETINTDYGGPIGKPMPPHQQMSSSFPMTNLSEPSNAVTSMSAAGSSCLPVSAPNIAQQNGMNGSNPGDANLLEGLPKTSPQNANMPINNMTGVQPNMVGSQGTPHTPQEGAEDNFDFSNFPENEQQDFLKMQQCMRGEDVKPNVGADSSDFPSFMQ